MKKSEKMKEPTIVRGFSDDEPYEYADGGGVKYAKGGNAFNWYDGMASRNVSELNLNQLKAQLYQTKPSEKERIEYLQKLISAKENNEKMANGGLLSDSNYSIGGL